MMRISFALVGRAIMHIPLGTAYAIWSGIGAAGAAIFASRVVWRTRNAVASLVVAGDCGWRAWIEIHSHTRCKATRRFTRAHLNHARRVVSYFHCGTFRSDVDDMHHGERWISAQEMARRIHRSDGRKRLPHERRRGSHPDRHDLCSLDWNRRSRHKHCGDGTVRRIALAAANCIISADYRRSYRLAVLGDRVIENRIIATLTNPHGA